jgi:hypothetical protein
MTRSRITWEVTQEGHKKNQRQNEPVRCLGNPSFYAILRGTVFRYESALLTFRTGVHH